MGMGSDDGEIDWLGLPKAEKEAATKKLYKTLSAVASATDQTIDAMVIAALPTEPGSDYRSNFRRGNIAAAKAQLIHRHLEEHHFDLAQQFEPSLFQTNPKSAWEQFLDAHTVVGGLRVVPHAQMGIARREAPNDADAITTLRLGQDFVLELTAPHAGFAIAFEEFQSHWHPLPLGADERRLRVRINDGVTTLPKNTNGAPIPLSEHDDTGLHRFVVIVSPRSGLPTDQGEIMRFVESANSAVSVLQAFSRVIA